jgi:hypothetical protein
MAAWTELDPNGLLPGEPWTAAKAGAVFENPKAMAEGATGAPVVNTRAMGKFSAGDTSAYLDANTTFISGNTFSPALVFAPHGSGTVRFKADLKAGAGGGSAELQVKVGGSVVHTFSNGALAFMSTTYDATVSLGDAIEVEFRSTNVTGDAEIRNVELATSGEQIIPMIFTTGNVNGLIPL